MIEEKTMADTTATEHETERLPVDPAALLTAGGVAKYLKISIRQVRKLDAEGLVPKPVRVGKSVRWRLSEIGEWIKANCPDRKTWEKRLESVRIGG